MSDLEGMIYELHIFKSITALYCIKKEKSKSYLHLILWSICDGELLIYYADSAEKRKCKGDQGLTYTDIMKQIYILNIGSCQLLT